MAWISVKDQLPDKDCMVLVADGQHVTLAGWTQRDGWMLDREDKAFGITADVLTHWMLLPAPLAPDQRES